MFKTDTKKLFNEVTRSYNQLKSAKNSEEKMALANYIGNLYVDIASVQEDDVYISKKTIFGSRKNYQKFMKKIDIYEIKMLENYVLQKDFHRDYLKKVLNGMKSNIKCIDRDEICKTSILSIDEYYSIFYDFMKEAIMANIILIGMPSCGKSTVGVLLAKNLGYRFIDSDILIQEREGKLLHEIISEQGLDGFIAVENAVNASIEIDRAVIATGGSVVYGTEAMSHLKRIGRVIYLKISYETLAARLGDYVHRGVVLQKGYTLRDMYEERAVLYEKYADVIIDEDSVGEEHLGQTLEKCMAACAEFI